MRLCTIKNFRSMFYAPGSEPSINTLRRQIDQKKIPGGTVMNGRYYIDLDEYDRATEVRQGLMESQREAAKNPLLAGLI